MANEERPTITWKRDEPQRPTIQRPNVDPPRPTIERPTIDIQRPTIQRPAPERPTISLGDTPAASPAQRPAPTPTQGRQDTGSHPGRKTDRSAHTSRFANVVTTHANNLMREDDGTIPSDDLLSVERTQELIDHHRTTRHRLGYDEDIQSRKEMLEASFKNRHNKDYGYEDLYE
jgi:hypothetical protein